MLPLVICSPISLPGDRRAIRLARSCRSTQEIAPDKIRRWYSGERLSFPPLRSEIVAMPRSLRRKEKLVVNLLTTAMMLILSFSNALSDKWELSRPRDIHVPLQQHVDRRHARSVIFDVDAKAVGGEKTPVLGDINKRGVPDGQGRKGD